VGCDQLCALITEPKQIKPALCGPGPTGLMYPAIWLRMPEQEQQEYQTPILNSVKVKKQKPIIEA
jgi:hypothetical protein